MTTLTFGRENLRRSSRPAGALLTDLVELVELWIERAHERRDLRTISEASLHDVALSRADVEREAAKPFWRA